MQARSAETAAQRGDRRDGLRRTGGRGRADGAAAGTLRAERHPPNGRGAPRTVLHRPAPRQSADDGVGDHLHGDTRGRCHGPGDGRQDQPVARGRDRHGHADQCRIARVFPRPEGGEGRPARGTGAGSRHRQLDRAACHAGGDAGVCPGPNQSFLLHGRHHENRGARPAGGRNRRALGRTRAGRIHPDGRVDRRAGVVRSLAVALPVDAGAVVDGGGALGRVGNVPHAPHRIPPLVLEQCPGNVVSSARPRHRGQRGRQGRLRGLPGPRHPVCGRGALCVGDHLDSRTLARRACRPATARTTLKGTTPMTLINMLVGLPMMMLCLRGADRDGVLERASLCAPDGPPGRARRLFRLNPSPAERHDHHDGGQLRADPAVGGAVRRA